MYFLIVIWCRDNWVCSFFLRMGREISTLRRSKVTDLIFMFSTSSEEDLRARVNDG